MAAAAGADEPSDVKLQGLQEKLEALAWKVNQGMRDLADNPKMKNVRADFSRDDIHDAAYLSIDKDGGLFGREITGPGRDIIPSRQYWTHVMSEGLGAMFNVGWSRPSHEDDDPRVLRLGEPIFNILRSRGLNPDWDGKRVGEMTITAVDEEPAKLALAMALHPRLGSDSPLSVVSSLPPTSPPKYPGNLNRLTTLLGTNPPPVKDVPLRYSASSPCSAQLSAVELCDQQALQHPYPRYRRSSCNLDRVEGLVFMQGG